LGYLLLGLIGIIEIVRGLRDKEKRYIDYVFESWFIFSAAYLFAATFLLPSGGTSWVISLRSWSFAFFGMSPLVAISLKRLMDNKITLNKNRKWLIKWRRFLPLILVFPLVSGFLTAPEIILEADYPRFDDSFYETGIWVRDNLPNATLALDPWSRSVIMPISHATTFESLRWPGGTVAFLNAIYQYGDFNSSISLEWDLIVFNKRMADWVPEASINSSIFDDRYTMIFDSESLSIYELNK
jgi:hypothetical protein